MDAWLEDRRQPKIPKKSPIGELIKEIATKPQANGLVASGAPMSVKYKETARGGLAVNIIEC